MRRPLMFLIYLVRILFRIFRRAPKRVIRAMRQDYRGWGDFPSAWAAHQADECPGDCWYCRYHIPEPLKRWFYEHPKGGKNRRARRSFLAARGKA